MAESTQAQKLRDFIKPLVDSGSDIGNPKVRTEQLKIFCEQNKLKFDPKALKKIRGQFNRELEKVLKDKGIPAQTLGLKKTKLAHVNRDMVINVRPEPVPVSGKAPIGAPPPTTPPAATPPPQVDERGNVISYYTLTVKHVSAFFAALYLVIKVKWEFLEDLTPEEKETLAEMWLPAFQKYLGENWKLIILPFVGTIGLLSPKIAKARKLQKTKGETKEKEKDIEKVGKMSCKFCMKLFERKELEEHEKVCTAK